MNYKKKRVCISIFILILVAILNLSNINALNEEIKKNELKYSFNHLKCKTDLTIGIIEYINNLDSESELLKDKNRLENSTSQMQLFLENNDIISFKEYLRTNIEPNLKISRSKISSWIRNNKKKLSNEEKTSFKEKYKELKQGYDNCITNSLKEYAQNRVDSFELIIQNHKNRTEALSLKGVDTTKLNEIINNGETEIINQLKEGIDSANNSKDILLVLNNYCLFNGCENGINFHLAIKYEIKKLEILSYMIKKSNNSSLLTSNVTLINNYLSYLKKELLAINKIKYSPEKEKEIEDNIKKAYKEINNIKQLI